MIHEDTLSFTKIGRKADEENASLRVSLCVFVDHFLFEIALARGYLGHCKKINNPVAEATVRCQQRILSEKMAHFNFCNGLSKAAPKTP